MMTKKTYLCPKCKKRNLAHNGFHQDRQRWLCIGPRSEGRPYCYSTLSPEEPYRGHRGETKRQEDAKPRKKFRRKIDTGKMMVFTAAQNATPVHEGFFATLRSFEKHNSAEFSVIPIRYKNATSIWTSSQRNAEHWLRDVAERELAEQGMTEKKFYDTREGGSWAEYLDDYSRKYLYEQKRKLNSNLMVRADIKIVPTKADPVIGLEGMTQGCSGIIGHTKLRLKCVATPQNKMPIVLTTTGACTVKNYSDTTVGKKGEHHHVLGACVVEIVNDKKFHIHQINARKSDGAFIFKNVAYFPDGSTEVQDSCQAMIFGDAHYRFADPKVVGATFDKGGLVETLNPEVLVWHDLLDCYFGNPHHQDNPFIKKAKHSANFHIAEDEVHETVAWMRKLSAGRRSYIVSSNHDDMLARWIIREDWKEQPPENQEFYLETALHMSRSAKMSDTGAEYMDPFGYWVERLTNPADEITALKRNQPFVVADIYLSYHGDKGPKGARGTVKNLSKLGVKLVTGHGHSQEIDGPHYRTGTMTRPVAEYVDGPNDWTNTHCSIDNFGKRHLHTCIDGNFWG